MKSQQIMLLCTIALTATASPLFADTVTVNCGAGGSNLQRTLDRVEADSTIVVRGTCANGPYIVRKNLTLEGTGTLSGVGDRVLDIIGAHVRIRGLTIDAQNANFGILIEEGSSGIVEGLLVKNSSGAGIQALLSSYAGVYGSRFQNNLYGVFVDASSSAYLAGDIFDGNLHADVAVFQSSSAQIVESQLLNGNIGILVGRLSSASASGNVAQNHTGPGLWVSSHISVLTLDGNTIESNGVDVECGARGLLIVNATQASSTQSTAIDPGCAVEGAPIF